MDKQSARQTLMKLLDGSTTVTRQLWATRRWVIWAAIALLSIGIVSRCHTDGKMKEYEKKMAVWKQERDSVLAVSDSIAVQNIHLRAEVDRLGSQADSIKGQNRKLQMVVNKQRTKNDSLLALAHTLPDTCKTAVEAAEGFKKEADDLRAIVKNDSSLDSTRLAAIKKLTVQNDTLTADNARLKKLVITVPEYHEPKLLGLISYPTRTQSFVAGVVTGVVVVSTVVVYFHK